ncbi:C3HC zinc finger-like-domain-containing protein [Lophiotrema nucula]|uniref:C3HC zinc finger-like-domain-containing protein n=1 Tax=Lophiotrema nucula TaxID=690887 RepID=A0A6A5ZCI2_9PLEO|nr:C3HC zinc finger-like-domain-containing protein [Lophiotrema nucula]
MSAEPGPAAPQALATQKRKFYKLIDNLGASRTSLANSVRESNTSTASLADPTTPEPASKRSRVSDVGMDRPRDASGDRIKALQEKLFTQRRGNERLNGKSVRAIGSNKAAPVQPSTPRKAPNFAPYSQEQFLARLKTFADVKKWTTKPDALGEVVWAKRGWSCDTWNTVACKGGCEQRVVIRLRPKRKTADGKELDMSEDLAVEIDDTLVERYQDLIVDGHAEECLWRKAGCKDDIYHIPIASREKSSTELLARYRSFRPIQTDLPLLENMTYPDPPVSEILKRIPPKLWNPPGSETVVQVPTEPTDVTAFTFALFGWSGVTEYKTSLAVCNHCFQRIGLWLSNDARLKEMAQKLDVSVESLRLNLLESHREHCPWKNAVTQDNPADGPIKKMAGWQTLQYMVQERKRPERRVEKSVDLTTDEISEYRGSFESEQGSVDDKESSKSLNDKWKRFKAKLKRTTSRKSLKSVKSAKSIKSTKSLGRDKENESARAP